MCVCARTNERERKLNQGAKRKEKKSNINCKQNGRHQPTERPTTKEQKKKDAYMRLMLRQEEREKKGKGEKKKAVPILPPSRE
jgi:hypothetical protein